MREFKNIVGAHLVEDLGRDAVELLARERAEQRPREVERLKDGAVLADALADELLLEPPKEGEGELGGARARASAIANGDTGAQGTATHLLLLRESLLSDDGLHRGSVLADGVHRVHLVRDVAVVATGEALANGRLHETRERREHVDGRVDLSWWAS